MPHSFAPAPPDASRGPGDGRVTVVVITRNRVDGLLAMLRRLEQLPERPRVVVVDNGSTDGTVEAVRRLHPAVVAVPLAGNAGSAARNRGVAEARTPYVAFADDDSWWAPGALARAADLFDAHPRLGLVNARILVGRDERLDPVCELMGAGHVPGEPDQPESPILSFVACGAVVRRAAFEQAGGFHPRLAVGGEEEVLAQDLAAAGWLMSYVPDVVAHHHPSARRDRAGRREIQLRNALWTTWLRRRAPAALRRTATVLASAPREPATVRGIARAVWGLPWVLSERRPLPAEVDRRYRNLQLAERDPGFAPGRVVEVPAGEVEKPARAPGSA